MKGIIIFKSQYGSTEQYAKWIGEKLRFPVVSEKEFNLNDVSKYGIIVLGTSVHAAAFTIKGWLNKNWLKIKNKKVIIFSVSGAPPEKTEMIKKILNNSISLTIQKKIKYFPLQGRLIFNKLPIIIRILMKLVANVQKDPKVKKGMTEDYDFVKKENIKPIVNQIKKLL